MLKHQKVMVPACNFCLAAAQHHLRLLAAAYHDRTPCCAAQVLHQILLLLCICHQEHCLKAIFVLCKLQNPIVTAVWSVCLVQVITPAVMFTAECHPYCKKLNLPELILVGAFFIYMTLCCTLSPGWYDANDIFGFYSLPLSFSYKMELICLACILGYTFSLLGARRLFVWYETRRILGAPHSSALTS